MQTSIPAYWHYAAFATLLLWALVFRMRLTWRSHLIAFFILGWAAALSSWSVSLDPAVGNVSGQVLTRSHKPVARAKVYYPDREAWVRTDKRGKFLLPSVPAGKKRRITVHARGFESTYDVVEVIEGKETANVKFEMPPSPPTFTMYNSERVFTTREKPSLNLSGNMVSKIHLDVYQADAERDRETVMRAPVSRQDLAERFHQEGSPTLQTDYNGQLNEDGEFSGTVRLDVHEPGLYLVRASAPGGNLVRNSWFLVTNLAVVTRRSPHEIVVYAQDFSTGQPLANVQIEFIGGGTKRAVTGKDGLFTWNEPGNGGFTLVARHGRDYAFERMDSLSSYDQANRSRVYLYTERPIYRPGHEVCFRGIARVDRDRHLSPPPTAERIRVKVQDTHGATIYAQTMSTDAFGAFTGRFSLPNHASLGDYSMTADWSGINARAEFKVAEYRKPEYHVDLSAGKPFYNSGETVRIKMDCRYFFGAPVTTAKVSYVVYESYYRWERAQFRDLEGEGVPEHYGGMTTSGSVELQADGTGLIQFAPGKSDHDRDFYVEVEVEDQSHRKVTANCDVLVTLGDFYLDADTDRWGYQPGEAVKATLRASDYSEKPQPNVAISASLVLEEYYEKTERNGVTHWDRREKEVWKGSAATDAKGRAAVTLQPPSDGSYLLRLSATDKAGNVIRADSWFFVSGRDSSFVYSSRGLQVLLDKQSYAAGGQARAVLSTTTPNTYVLLTVDGRRIHEKHLVHVKGVSATVPLHVRADYMPNVTVTAVAIKDKSLLTDEKTLAVSAASKLLKVKIVPRQKTYEPAQEAVCDVHVTDGQGRPVIAQFSLGVVDLAIYSLAPDATEKIYDFFYGPESSYVRTEYSFAPDYSGGRNKEDDPRIRRNFKDTAFWNGALQTDSGGNATVKFALPDNLTTWRFTARAVTLDSLVGEATAEVVVRKPLLVRLEVPRFITQHDAMELSAVVHNESGADQDVEAAMRVEGLVLKSAEGQKFHMPNGTSHRFAWTVEAGAIGTAKAVVTARGQGYSDGMELSFPVLPHGTEHVQAQSGSADPEARLTIDRPAEAEGRAAKLTVYLSPSVASTALQSLEYLATYPHGCVEQTMSSFLPDIEVARALRELHVQDANARLLAELPDMVARGLDRLYELQHADGGWGWWTDDATHPYMTAYVVYGLYKAQKAGYPVRDSVYKRGVAELWKLLGDEAGEFRDFGGEIRQRTKWNGRAYMAWVLTVIGERPYQATQAVRQHQDALNSYTRSLLAMALWNLDKKDEARAVLADIMKTADETATTCRWNTETFDYSWVENPVEATAYVLKAMVAVQPDNPRIGKTVRWLVDYRQGPIWNSTKDTGAVVGAMTDYLMTHKTELAPDFVAQVFVNDKSVAQVPVKSVALGEAGVVEVPAEMLRAGKNELRIVRQGSGSLYWSEVLRTYPDQEDVTPDNQGLLLVRSYHLVTVSAGKDGKPVENVTPLAAGAEIPLGARVRVTLRVTNDKPYSYVMIEDKLIPGCELSLPEEERNSGGYWYIGREVHDDRYSVFVTRLEAGKHELVYEVFAEAPGTYHVRPAEAYLMYHPEVRGTSPESHLRIGAEKP